MNPQRHTPMDPAEMREGSAVRLPPRGTRPGANASSPAMQGRVCARGGAGGRRHLVHATSPVLEFPSSFTPRERQMPHGSTACFFHGLLPGGLCGNPFYHRAAMHAA